MVLTGHCGKNKPKPARASTKMTVKSLAKQHTASPARSGLANSEEEDEADLNLSGSPTLPQSGMSQTDFLKHMKSMLQRALKVTSDQILIGCHMR